MIRRPDSTARRLHALSSVIERGRRVAEALADELPRCRTSADTVRVAEAFSQVAEEVCSAIALEAELTRQRTERAAPATADMPVKRVH